MGKSLFQPGNQLAKGRSVNRLTAKKIEQKLADNNFDWIDEAVKVYHDPTTKTGEKIRIIEMVARKVAPDLKSVEMTGDVDVNRGQVDVTGLSIEELTTLVKVAGQIGGEDDEVNSDSSEESDEE